MPRPVFVFDSTGDLEIAAVDRAPALMEPVDVEAGEFTVYGVDGELLRPVVRDGTVELVDTGEIDGDDLLDRLRRFVDVAQLDVPAGVADYPIAVANALALWNWEHRWPTRPAWLSRRFHGVGPPEFERS